MRHPYRTTAVSLSAVLLLTGCSWTCMFDFTLTVSNADDGKPVPGVTVILDYIADPETENRKQAMDQGSLFGSTDAEGKLTKRFGVGGYTSGSGPWYLKLQKEGFEPVVMDISPKTSAEKGTDSKNPLPVTVKMKPLAKK